MPLINVSGPVIDTECKRRLAEGLTKAAAEAYGFTAEDIIVVIQEFPLENVAAGGVLLADQRREA